MIRWQTMSLKTLTTASTAKHRSANLYLKNPCIGDGAGIFIGCRFAGGEPKTEIEGAEGLRENHDRRIPRTHMQSSTRFSDKFGRRRRELSCNCHKGSADPSDTSSKAIPGSPIPEPFYPNRSSESGRLSDDTGRKVPSSV